MRVYIYENHSWDGEFLLRDAYLTDEETFCSICEASDTYLGYADTLEQFDTVINSGKIKTTKYEKACARDKYKWMIKGKE